MPPGGMHGRRGRIRRGGGINCFVWASLQDPGAVNNHAAHREICTNRSLSHRCSLFCHCSPPVLDLRVLVRRHIFLDVGRCPLEVVWVARDDSRQQYHFDVERRSIWSATWPHDWEEKPPQQLRSFFLAPAPRAYYLSLNRLGIS
jgi:hypothetical protein